jgi:GNAT superfamily N-acetyltransferase
MEILLATKEDAPAIESVLSAAFSEYEPLYTPAGYAATTPNAERIRERMSEGPCWVASHGGAIVGTVAAVARGEGVYVRSMAVLPAARGLGVGRALLGKVERFALGAGASQLYLSTTPFLDRAILLYEHNGFRRTDEGPQELFGTPLFTMVKGLGPSGP